MKTTGPEILIEALSALKRYLADVPFCTLEAEDNTHPTRDTGVDFTATLRLPDGNRLLGAHVEPSGQPRRARDAANLLLRWASQVPNAVPLFVAPYISPAAADILTRDGIGYVDLAGNCRLAFDRVYIRREDWPNKLAKRRDLRSLYSPKAERVVRLLLLEPKRRWKVQALAQAAGVSIGQASNVKRLLEDREWIGRVTGDGVDSSSSTGFVVTQPAKLLAEWAQNYRFNRNTVREFYSPDTLAQVEAKLTTACRDAGAEYALTGFSAAARIAPMVRYQRTTAYVAGSVDNIAARLGLKPVSSGANVSLLEPYDAGVFAGSREVEGIRIASAVQTYLDLLSFKGRGEEAAQAVLEQVIQPQW
jgi:hypothetical protein